MDKESHELNNRTISGDPLAIRKRGRPFKNSHTTSGDPLAKPKRGRPVHNNNHTTSADFMAIRKRGRPRKHVKLDDSNNSSPPGFSRSQHQSLHNEAMVGQQVTGLIEATFEDGFLLSVKVGGSDTMLRGVVFKHGHFHPVSPDNDVAPHVPMITRHSDVVDGLRGARALVSVPIQPKLPVIPNHLLITPVLQNGSSGHVPVRYGHCQVRNESEEQALAIEPLQAIHPVHPVHVPEPMPSYGRGNMTELLQAVQENVRETHFSQGQ